MSWPRRRRREHPDPPRNVRLTHPDGRVIPLDCVYVGVENRMHLWEAAWVLPWSPADPWHIEMDYLPGRTAVKLRFDVDTDGI